MSFLNTPSFVSTGKRFLLFRFTSTLSIAHFAMPHPLSFKPTTASLFTQKQAL